MTQRPVDVYSPRKTTDHGVWDMGTIQFKVYGLLAEGTTITPDMIQKTEAFLKDQVLPKATEMGNNNGLGFAIIHPGELGLTIGGYWWAQGSVLCQQIYRHEYKHTKPLDTISRPAVACVWELQIITAEEKYWRQNMMRADHSAERYLQMRAG
ncbi:MAG: hypothetical protein AAGA53_17240 [Pseudomonadota bacterium]